MVVSSRHGSLPVLAALVAATPVAVRAQDVSPPIERPTIAVSIDATCADVDEAIVRRVLAVELGPDADVDAAIDLATARVRARCEDVRVTLELDEAITGKHLTRAIDLGDTPADGRSRLVALAMAELVSASWIELGMRHDPEIRVVDAAPSEETRAIALEIARGRMPEPDADEDAGATAPAPPRARPLGIRAIGVGRLGGEPLHFAGGGGLALDWEFFAPLAILVDARAEHGTISAGDLGDVGTTMAHAGAMLAIRLPLGPHHADFGVGGRFGAAWLDGLGRGGVSGAQVVGPVAGVCTATHLSVHIAYSAYLHLGAEVAWITLPVRGTNAATGAEVASISGAQLAITLGFEVRPE